MQNICSKAETQKFPPQTLSSLKAVQDNELKVINKRKQIQINKRKKETKCDDTTLENRENKEQPLEQPLENQKENYCQYVTGLKVKIDPVKEKLKKSQQR